MVDRESLLSDLQSVLRNIEADLLDRSDSDEVSEVREWLREEYTKAKDAERTAQTQQQWTDDFITQVAAAWVLSCVFVRFLEDNGLIDPPKISGPGPRLERARDEHTLFFQDLSRAKLTDREYLLDIFKSLAKVPAVGEVFGKHNPLNTLPNWLGPDAAGELLRFFQKIDANSGSLIHDFTDPEWDTRFLGDLYQDLSEAARKKYALLQTPDFVEEFILDRTLDPALDEFGLTPDTNSDHLFKMIDPACGSGHFLLGAFPRILKRWQKEEPGTNIRELVQRTLDSIHGVDINPFAIAIARFRLLLAALAACGVKRLADAPAFAMNLACGDSLYHGRHRQLHLGDDWTDESHYFRTEDSAELRNILKAGTFHCVVANPPYITPKDQAANTAYRRLYSSCHMKYSLAVPFMERIIGLGVSRTESSSAGFWGQITANSFMNNEFGKKLIEEFLPNTDLTHIVDTRFVQPPGHATPTVILFGKNQAPLLDTVRVVMGIRGEDNPPEDLAHSRLWQSIVTSIDLPGTENDLLSVVDSSRDTLAAHPWSLAGGGAAELKTLIEQSCIQTLADLDASVGFMVITGDDDAFLLTKDSALRARVPARPLYSGDAIRDWLVEGDEWVIFPYHEVNGRTEPISLAELPTLQRLFWPIRRTLQRRSMFKKTITEHGKQWCEHIQFIVSRVDAERVIAFAYKVSHNNFAVRDRGDVFCQTSPVITLPPGTPMPTFVSLAGLMNSSTAAFWEQQQHREVSGRGLERWEVRLERNGTKVVQFPVSENWPQEHSAALYERAVELDRRSPDVRIRDESATGRLAQNLLALSTEFRRIVGEMIFLQEELDWQCYQFYGVVGENLTYSGETFPIIQGERAFEIVLARKMERGEVQTSWFERHNSTPITGIPAHWPDDYQHIVARRIEVIASDSHVGLIEQPEFKRRWAIDDWEQRVARALQASLLDRLERYFDLDGRMNEDNVVAAQYGVSLVSLGQLADVASRDEQFIELGAAYRDDNAFNVIGLVDELVSVASVPLLPVLRYKDTGLRKRDQWEETWELQRREDAGEEVGEIPAPPKYASGDFVSSGGARYWELRGKLDVPKERWISFPQCDAEDGTLMICWAGYDHLQQATAVAAYFVRVKEEIGGADDPRLVPLLGCLVELLPWLKQWHNEPNAEFDGLRMGDYYEGFINEEARNLPRTTTNADGEEVTTSGWTIKEIKAWQPPQRTGGRRRRRSTN
ncbi:MAG: BREX-2 system adenine-specific DNA-methyltransferase PglX [Fuerstiella sp.]